MSLKGTLTANSGL
jgi:hypothetical protein